MTNPYLPYAAGYNIIGYWNKLKKRRDSGDMSGAREALFEEVKKK